MSKQFEITYFIYLNINSVSRKTNQSFRDLQIKYQQSQFDAGESQIT